MFGMLLSSMKRTQASIYNFPETYGSDLETLFRIGVAVEKRREEIKAFLRKTRLVGPTTTPQL